MYIDGYCSKYTCRHLDTIFLLVLYSTRPRASARTPRTLLYFRTYMHAVRRAIPTRRLYCTPAASALPKKKPFPIFAGSVYVGTLTAVLAAWLDERLDIRKWKQVQYNVVRSAESGNSSEVIEVSLRARTRPPPIGAMEWPAGRVLLQWSLDEALLGDEAAGTALTLGEGIGVTAIGLAKARQQRAKGNDGDVLSSRRSRIVATDFCDDSLELLASNACASGWTTRASSSFADGMPQAARPRSLRCPCPSRSSPTSSEPTSSTTALESRATRAAMAL